MEGLKSLFVKPDPNAQMRKCNALIRSNIRKLDRDITQVKNVELKTKNLIIAADRRAQRNPQQARQAQREVRDFARELLRARRTSARLVTSKAQLNSVQMQVNEAFAVRKIEGSIRASVGVMKDVNALVRLPQLAGTMRELSMELMKAGVIEEMVGESLPVDDMLEDEEEEAEGEVDKVLGEILKGRMEKAGTMPSAPLPEQNVPEPVEEDEEDQEAMMDQMRNRLEALRS
ncbi:Snf7 family protein [Hypomontagnella submonticulosa]|nr:Snf7 family protein [Hypomontagnella submonticulosa]